MQRAHTQTISIDAPTDVVFDLVADPLSLPRWAPGFARAVRPEGDDWIVETDDGELRIRVRVSPEQRTVDYLATALPAGVEVGAFTRVVPNGRGSAYAYTQFFPAAMSREEVARQKAVIADELRTVQALCERRGTEEESQREHP